MESGGLIGYPEYPFPWPLHSCAPVFSEFSGVSLIELSESSLISRKGFCFLHLYLASELYFHIIKKKL